MQEIYIAAMMENCGYLTVLNGVVLMFRSLMASWGKKLLRSLSVFAIMLRKRLQMVVKWRDGYWSLLIVFIHSSTHSSIGTFMWKTNIMCVLGQCSCSRWRYSSFCVKATHGPLGRFTTGGCKGLNTHSALYFSLGLVLMPCSNQAKWPRKILLVSLLTP